MCSSVQVESEPLYPQASGTQAATIVSAKVWDQSFTIIIIITIIIVIIFKLTFYSHYPLQIKRLLWSPPSERRYRPGFVSNSGLVPCFRLLCETCFGRKAFGERLKVNVKSQMVSQRKHAAPSDDLIFQLNCLVFNELQSAVLACFDYRCV